MLDLPLHDRTLGTLLAAQAAQHTERPFLLFEEQRFTYREADRLANRLANGLLAAGIAAGDHVALYLDNKPEIVWLHFALARIGAIPVPINTAARGEILSYYLNNSDSCAIVLDSALLPRFLAVQEGCEKLRLGIVVAEGDAAADLDSSLPLIAYGDVLSQSAEPPDIAVKFSDLAHIYYTSGTTGPSKGCMVAHATAIGISMKYVRGYGYTSQDVLYTCLPLFHGNAFNCTLLPALLCGACVALSRRFSASRFWSQIKHYKATQFTLLSAMTTILWKRPEGPEDRDHGARLCQVVPIPEFFQAFEERFNVKLTSLYSLSDFGLAAMLPPDHPPDKWRAAGKILPDVAVAILDEDDLPLPTGQTGEICLRNLEPWVCRQGYYGMPEAFMKACRNLWFHTGDRGYLDSDGYLYFVDRKKDVIRRRGENISAYEVEQILARHPAVAEVAAYPVRSELSEDEVMITVVRQAGKALDAAALINFCAENMAYFMVPRYVEFVDALPKTMTEKVEKFRLRQSAEARLDRLWDREREGIVIAR